MIEVSRKALSTISVRNVSLGLGDGALHALLQRKTLCPVHWPQALGKSGSSSHQGFMANPRRDVKVWFQNYEPEGKQNVSQFSNLKYCQPNPSEERQQHENQQLSVF
jgi:hypothetical protein